jgi:hypothetical protein
MKTYEQYLAFIYINNADQAKYGTIMAGLITQQSLGNDQYPRTITEASTVLSNHQFDYSTPKSKNPNIKKEKEKPQEQINLSFAHMKGRFYCFGKEGHQSPPCRDKNKLRDEWAINQV